MIEDCALCHDGVIGDDVTAETRRSLEEACFQCHSDERDDCSFCHSDVASAGVFPEKERHLTFSHETHIVRTFGDCETCHSLPHGAADSPFHPSSLPDHDECFSCHQMQEFYDQLDCQACHEQLLQYGLKPYEEFSHGPDWLHREHGLFVQNPENAETCAQCHDQPFCSECHDGEPTLRLWERSPEKVSRTFIHAGDYVHRHMWDARADSASCMRCHQQNWCSDCHSSRGISEIVAQQRTDGFRFHGPGVLTPRFPRLPRHRGAARHRLLRRLPQRRHQWELRGLPRPRRHRRQSPSAGLLLAIEPHRSAGVPDLSRAVNVVQREWIGRAPANQKSSASATKQTPAVLPPQPRSKLQFRSPRAAPKA